MTSSITTAGEIIDVRPLGTTILDAKHMLLVDSENLKVKRMVLAAGKELAEHKAPSDITVQCLEGRIEFTAMGRTQELEPGQMIHLATGELHAVRAIEDSSFLLTIAKVR